MTRRVVITGMGTVNSLAFRRAGFWSALSARARAASAASSSSTRPLSRSTSAAKSRTSIPKRAGLEDGPRLDRFAQFALVASIYAVKDSGMDFSKEDPFRCGVIVGSGIGGLNEFEEQHARYIHGGPDKISPFVIPENDPQRGGRATSRSSSALAGPNTAVSTACASAANAIGDAFRAIQWGYADVMITGGSESVITKMGLGGFIAARALSLRNDDPTKASRPFDHGPRWFRSERRRRAS